MVYRQIVKPLSDRIFPDPEVPHDIAIKLGHYAPYIPGVKETLKFFYGFEDERLETRFCRSHFSNPTGLAAGFDKNSQIVEILPYLGFGFAVRGSITARPCKGNKKRPRIFRLPKDKGLINNAGLHNNGTDEIYKRVKDELYQIPMITSIASTPGKIGEAAIEDFYYTFNKFKGCSDMVTLNLSCPNTKEGKSFEDPEALDQLLSAIMPKSYIDKVLIKLSPDLSYEEINKILDVSQSHKVDGYVVANTSTKRDNLYTSKARLRRIGSGGFSGPDLNYKSSGIIAYIYGQIQKAQIIGVGGILTGFEAVSKIQAGATLVKAYNGVVQKGPGWASRINKEIIEHMEMYGVKKIEDLVGMHA